VMLYPRCVNAYQTAERRRLKYSVCRRLGFNNYEARRMRDWDWRFIKWFYQRWFCLKTPTVDISRLREKVSKERAAIYYREKM
jgi:hypothetical protein